MNVSAALREEKVPALSPLLDAVDRLSPTLSARAPATERNRCLPAETMQDLFSNGILHFFVPRRFGGLELEWGGQIELGRRLARSCASTAWITTVVGSHTAYLARMEPQAQQDVWSQSPDVLVATGSLAREVSVDHVPGGYRVSGKWSFCSGVDHAGWALLRASPDGDHRQAYFLFPRDDFTIIDDWFVSGMSGTGSKSVRIENAFVPVHRTLDLTTLMSPDPPGSKIHNSYVYSYNFRPFTGTNLLGPLVGGAEAVLSAYRQLLSEGTPGLDIDDVQTQLRLGEAEAEIAAAVFLMESLIARQQAFARGNIDVPHPQRIALVRDRTFAARLCFTAAERLISSLDQSVMLSGHAIERSFRDLCGMIQQIGVNWDRNISNAVKASFGRPSIIPFLNLK